MIKKIIVTGSSDSTGMEMVDHLLENPSSEDRRMSIWKWYKKNYKVPQGISVSDLYLQSDNEFTKLERKHSWPALLESETGIQVINLSNIGYSIGASLIEFSNYCDHNLTEAVAIHQLPPHGRFYLRFDNERINVCPSDNINDPGFLQNHGFNKKYFRNDIKKLESKYKYIIKKDVKTNYITKHYDRCLERIQKIANAHKIKNFYITRKDQNLPNVLINDFEKFKEAYKKGRGGHPIDPRFNEDVVKTIRSKLGI